ncbi:hypothetical protein V2W45_1473512 [Cenococcum geophilum]
MTLPKGQSLTSELDSDSISDSDLCSNLSFDLYSDLDTKLDTDIETDNCIDPDLGLVKPNHTPQIKKLWKREGEIWERYCEKIKKRTKKSPKDHLRECNPEKRISLCYRDLTNYRMDSNIPSLGLNKSEKEKHAIYVDDTKPLYGFIRVQISLLLLLSAATATRPEALVESASAKGSNKALWFKDINIIVSTIMVNVNLEHIKNKKKNSRPKKFTFRLKGLLAFCIVSYILAIGISWEAFRDNFISKDEVLNQPFFCDVRHITGGVDVLKDKAFLYLKYRNIFTMGHLGSIYENIYFRKLQNYPKLKTLCNAKRKIERLNKAICDFYDLINTIKIARQLSGKALTKVLTLPRVEFEIQERATITKNGNDRIKFVYTLARLSLKRKKTDFNILDDPTLGYIAFNSTPSQVLPHPICLIYISNEEFIYKRRMRKIPQKDVLNKEFKYYYPECLMRLEGIIHFKRHACNIHGVFY